MEVFLVELTNKSVLLLYLFAFMGTTYLWPALYCMLLNSYIAWLR